ncbi:MAG: ribosome-associated translation inhibitor RaiA, partial [Nitrospinae bacterium]|nr:ribosome-associated translation inhibitor RaiA [Nitrospinota bacterium]
MQVTVTGRRIEITDALRNHAEEKVLRLKRYQDRSIDAHIVLSVEKYRHTAEVTINFDGTIIHGKEETEDMYSSIDRAVDKIERQMKSHKKRIIALKNKREAEIGEREGNIEGNIEETIN